MNHKKAAREARKAAKDATKRGDSFGAHANNLRAAYHGVSKRDLKRQIKDANRKG